jgi:hypothetical protein
MKIPLDPEIINAPLDYVAEFYYISKFSLLVSQRMLEDQCKEMHIHNVSNPVYDDCKEYIDWVQSAGTQLITALSKDSVENRSWWSSITNLKARKDRIKQVLINEWYNVTGYSND